MMLSVAATLVSRGMKVLQRPLRVNEVLRDGSKIMFKKESVVEYKGFLLIERVYPGTATSRIRRADGTWRDSAPTFVCEPWSVWVVALRLSNGDVEELGEMDSFAAAESWVDREFDRPQ